MRWDPLKMDIMMYVSVCKIPEGSGSLAKVGPCANKIHNHHHRHPEGSELANMVANDAKIIAKLVSKNDANLALPLKFRQVLIESPLLRQPRSSRWIRKKCPGLLRSSVLLLDDNARLHSAKPYCNSWLEGLHHQHYSPDLATSDFHLRLLLKKNLAGRRFGSNAEVKQAVKLFFRMQSLEFFLEGFLKLIKWYDKCLNVLGTYVEK
ncbi:histone-lysine N-methyltransferase SETMAR [Trichonephila clavipes]|nr:histone-lysine N-methyltransferase SETMAR [Trichonephila clavipes]